MPKETREKQNGRLLTDIAMNVRMAVSGASEIYDGINDDIDILEQAIKTWKFDSPPLWTTQVDMAVYGLVKSVLFECYRDNGFWMFGLRPKWRETRVI